MLKSTRNKKGWLLPYLIALDNMFFNRWDYWLTICQNNSLPDKPIPFIPFKSPSSYPEKLVQKNLRDCLEQAYQYSNRLELFVDWLLWGFNSAGKFPCIDERLDDYWYRKFNLGLFYLEPADHWSTIACEYLNGKNGSGFFPTPAGVVEMMIKIQFGKEPELAQRTLSVLDPACGTGIMLLYASNYSLNLFGNDISVLLTKIARINAFIYVPWIIYRPEYLTIFDKHHVIEQELFSGVKIPKCTCCPDDAQRFSVDLQTQHEILLNNDRILTIKTPNLNRDLVELKLKPENISCANHQRSKK